MVDDEGRAEGLRKALGPRRRVSGAPQGGRVDGSRLRPGRVCGLAAAAMVGCAEGGEPTPTASPPGEAPGQGRVIGALSVAYGEAFNYQTGQPVGTDIINTVIVAGFVDPASVEPGEVSTELPVVVELPSGGAIDTCSFSVVVESTVGRIAPAETGLLNVGAEVTAKVDGAELAVPLVDDAWLPPPYQGQPLPPAYLLIENSFDPELYRAGVPYGLAIDGAEALAGFDVADVVSPPEPLVMLSPDIEERQTLSLDADLDLSWEESPAQWIVVDLRVRDTGEALTCPVVDDGAFTIPLADLDLLSAGEATLTLTRVVPGYVEVRLGEWLLGVGASAVSGSFILERTSSRPTED